ncbi:hypothetical protein CVT25_000392 [Psilocybe cyanescens]|uniref:Uncharacterized protein n=1 Tax=Psilocybe cyanescens TaxID=93625 RepID=A0A409XYN2_PSICY|nr:hypothetical protein CVT25_000392 [Psilocybe cyanescens]
MALAAKAHQQASISGLEDHIHKTEQECNAHAVCPDLQPRKVITKPKNMNGRVPPAKTAPPKPTGCATATKNDKMATKDGVVGKPVKKKPAMPKSWVVLSESEDSGPADCGEEMSATMPEDNTIMPCSESEQHTGDADYISNLEYQPDKEDEDESEYDLPDESSLNTSSDSAASGELNNFEMVDGMDSNTITTPCETMHKKLKAAYAHSNHAQPHNKLAKSTMAETVSVNEGPSKLPTKKRQVMSIDISTARL